MFILRIIVGLVAGAVLGMVVMMGLHLASTLIYAPPEGVEFMSQDAENLKRMRKWFSTLPAGAFVMATLCHGLGCLTGAVSAMFIAGRHSLISPLIIAGFFTLGGIMNMQSMPHPVWFPLLDLPIYIVPVWCVAKALQTPSAEHPPGVQSGAADSPSVPSSVQHNQN